MNFDEIAKQFSAFNGNDESKIFDTLLNAFWSGDLEAQNITRLDLLKSIRTIDIHPNFFFHDQDNYELSTYYPDGSVIVADDIKLSENISEWQEGNIQKAYEKLSSIGLNGYNKIVHPALDMLVFSYQSFRKWSDKDKRNLDDFWCSREYLNENSMPIENNPTIKDIRTDRRPTLEEVRAIAREVYNSVPQGKKPNIVDAEKQIRMKLGGKFKKSAGRYNGTCAIRSILDEYEFADQRNRAGKRIKS